MRWIAFAVTLALLISGLVYTEVHKITTPVAPTALLYLVADSERELTRIPMHYTRIPDADEIKIGDSIARGFSERRLDDENREIEAYLNKVGDRVAARAHRKLPYKFHYVPDRYFINAFALPGGHVYMGAGLMNLMETEDELAAVLGHEIEHIDHYHCAERLQLERAMRKVPLLQLASLPIEVFQAGYSKDQELEADREGTELAVAAGYSPEGAVQIFAELQKLEEEYYGHGKSTTPEKEISEATIRILTGYFESHPPSVDRIAKIRDLIAARNWSVSPSRPLEVRYIFLGHQAEELLASAKYAKAAERADAALKLHAHYPVALAAMAKAKLAMHDFPAAAAAYRELLPLDPGSADTVRASANERGVNALKDKRLAEATQLATWALDLQPNNPEALKLLAEAKLEQGEMEAALDAGRRLLKLYPATGSQLMQYSTEASDRAYQAYDYERAARFAAYALRLDSANLPSVRRQLARSEFALARFKEAAQDYRLLVEYYVHNKTAIDLPLMHAYSDALGCLEQHSAAALEFHRVLAPLVTGKDESDSFNSQARIEEAGLRVMAGDETLARQFSDGGADSRTNTVAPETVARLGWWYYRAGKYDAADQLLRRFLAMRPGDPGLQAATGWVAIEKGAPADAARFFRSATEEDAPWRAAAAGNSVAEWRLRQIDPAMLWFEQPGRVGSSWNNPVWVKALFGPVTIQTLQEMRAEEDRRIAARRSHRR